MRAFIDETYVIAEPYSKFTRKQIRKNLWKIIRKDIYEEELTFPIVRRS